MRPKSRSKAKGELELEYRPVADLKPYIRNPRTHSKKQIAQLVESIKEFGWTNPILVDGANGIIAGHGRLLAAMEAGMTQVPCIELAGMTEAQKRAYVIADNRLALSAGWDMDLLSLEVADLKALDFNLELTGFTQKELDALLRGKTNGGEQAKIPILETADLTDLAPSEEEAKILSGRKIMVEFSGGKDSSAAAVWAKHFFPQAELTLCYVDMGAEYIGFFFFLQRFAEALGCELKVLRSRENVIAAFLAKRQWPAFVGPWCHDLLHEPLDEHLRSFPAGEIACIRGGRLKEKARTGKTMDSRFLTIERMEEYIYFQPLYFTVKDVGEKIIRQGGFPFWEGYSMGLQRTACRICPGQRPATYAAIRQDFCGVWAELQELESRMGPGCWQASPGPGLRATFGELAEKGREAYKENISRTDTGSHASATTVQSHPSAGRRKVKNGAHRIS